MKTSCWASRTPPYSWPCRTPWNWAAQQQLSAEEYLALLQETLTDEQQMAQYRAQAAQAAQEEADSIKVLTDEQSALNEAQSAAKTMQNARQMRAYVNEVKNGAKGTRTYKAAVEGLKKEYGDLFPNIEDSIDAIDGLVGAQEESAQKAVSAARTAIQNLMESQRRSSPCRPPAVRPQRKPRPCWLYWQGWMPRWPVWARAHCPRSPSAEAAVGAEAVRPNPDGKRNWTSWSTTPTWARM